ncbi:MAG: hypothetical protein ONB44_15925 [candidate division KSB1 bacterium]|nr:hypothetical protein [candidate division KSB1 bacterium]MDZ7303621.1 hypothetical protein [candidate division KSB1 bacterium]MDZ7312858.1 hypothetical protein [candidate division KSB1 bacterium]
MSDKLDKIIEELQFLSDRISTQVRTIAVSLIALVWAMFVGGKEAPNLPSLPERRQLLIAAGLALATMFCDYLQYFFGYLATNLVRKRAEADPKAPAEYDYSDWRYRLRVIMFWAKQALLGVAVVYVAVLLAQSLFG